MESTLEENKQKILLEVNPTDKRQSTSARPTGLDVVVGGLNLGRYGKSGMGLWILDGLANKCARTGG